MQIIVHRKWKKETYTIGRLFVDGVFVCNTLEDKDRNLFEGMGEKAIREIKVQDETAIPYGRYKVDMDTVSPKYSKKKRYMDICEGKVPRLEDVPGFSGILIHIGNYANPDTSGCILVGKNDKKGMVTHSTETFIKLYNMMKEAKERGEEIWIDID